MARVIVVDDSGSDRQYMATLLKYAGHVVMLSADGSAGLGLIKKERPDLVIIDLITPGIDGYELARAVRADPGTTATPIILQTAHYLESEVQRIAAQIGIQQVLIKPFEPQVFLDADAKTLADKVPVHRGGPASSETGFLAEHLRLLSAQLSENVMELGAPR